MGAQRYKCPAVITVDKAAGEITITLGPVDMANVSDLLAKIGSEPGRGLMLDRIAETFARNVSGDTRLEDF